jgi:hypothetical protein
MRSYFERVLNST